MKLTKASGMLGLLALSAVTSSSVLADDSGWPESGWYIGGNVGQSRAVLGEQEFTSYEMGVDPNAVLFKTDNHDTGYKLYGGYQFNRYFALEGGYFDLGKFNFSGTVPAGTVYGTAKVRGGSLDLVGSLPFTSKWSAFAKVGVDYNEAKDSFDGTGFYQNENYTEKNHGGNPHVGVGFQYAFNESLALRIEADRYRLRDGYGGRGDGDLVSAGLVYHFGAKAKSKPLPAPVPVAAPVTPPPPRFEKATLSAKELFAFDSAEIQSPQPKLDDIANALKGTDGVKATDANSVVVSGYTDRIGSTQYNQKLSERRAQAVKDYLVSKGVDGNRLRIEGKGEANPVVECNDKNRSALIKCLEPNRRAEVQEITIEREVRP